MNSPAPLSFKLVFSPDDIRRISLATPSWEAFNQQLVELYPEQFHPELTIKYKDDEKDLITITTEKEWNCMLEIFGATSPIKLYVSESKNAGRYFKDGPLPTPQGCYTKDAEEKITICGGDSYKRLEIEVPKCLSRLFPGGKILPYNVPSWLQGCVELKKVPGPDPVVDLDIDVYRLFDTLHEQAVSMIGPEQEESALRRAKEFLQSMIELVPNHPIANYNMACAQSLLGEIKEAFESLKRAIQGGYNDAKHLFEDPDLANLRKVKEEFEGLVALILSPKKQEEKPEEKEPEIEEKKEEPKVEEKKEEPKVEEKKEEPKVEEKKEEPKYAGKWQPQLEALSDMGFNNMDVNLALLDLYKGDLVKVVNALLSQ